ncbi:MAG: DUF948 domain-containing protein [Eggerthellaceae bacterium]|nr:DUF948 domain-containing protein [Eggerthellaceae bacterium]
MTFGDVLNIILPIVYILVGCALVWFVVELALFMNKTRKVVTDVKDQLDPTLENVEKLTKQLEPTLQNVEDITAGITPVVERVNLTVDAANLEIMRLDQILEDVSGITDSLSSTMNTVDTVTSAPVEFVTSVAARVRSRFRPKYASDESVKIGEGQNPDQKVNPVKEVVDAASDVAQSAIDNQKAWYKQRKEAHAAKKEANEAREARFDKTANNMTDAVLDTADEDSSDATKPGK